MTDPELQELAALWKEPGPSEREAFEAAARKARRLGRLLAWVDVAFAALLVLGAFLGFVLEPGPMTIGVVIVFLVVTTYVMWKRRELRQMSPAINTSDRRSFLESSVRMAAANVRRITLGLYFLPLGIAMGVVFKLALRGGGTIDRPLERFAAWLPSTRGILTITVAGLFIAWTYRRRRRAQAELSRLKELQRAYEDEALRAEWDDENR